MKLLICTQVVDAHDPHLGFFVRWIEEFQKHVDVEVITLKRLGRGKIWRTLKLLYLTWTLPYERVFVHMNPEYVVAAGWVWKLRGKKIGLWYTHKSVDLKLRIAEKFARVISTASKESFRLPSKKVHVMGHGIDTDFFTPSAGVVRGEHWLSVGRLSKSKRHDLAIRLAHERGKALRVVGEGPERPALESLVRELGAQVTFTGGLTQEGLRDEYRKASLLLHTSETGSLDKVVLEALSCGLPLRTNDPALTYLESQNREYIREHHSLQKLIPAILNLLV